MSAKNGGRRGFFTRAAAWLTAHEGLTAALVAALFLCVAALVQQISFATNDDNAVAFALAGYQTGAPYPYALFINCLLGYLVSGLYAVLPAVPWWAALQLLALFFSFTGVGAALLRVCARHGRPLWGGLCLYAAFLLLFCLQPVILLTYTVTAAALGACAAALTAAAAREPDAKRRRLYRALGLAAVVGAFLYREETGFAALCFYGAALLYQALSGGWKRALLLLAAAALLCGGAFAFNNAMHARVDGPAYTAFFRERERFTDYPRDAYADNPALYEAAGWDEPLYRLADEWYFLDERIDAASLRTITEGSAAQRVPLSEALTSFADAFGEDPAARCMPLYFLLAAAFLIGARLCGGQEQGKGKGKRQNRACLLTGLAALLGGACLCLYLCIHGRFPLRSMQVVALPCAALVTALAADAETGGGTAGKRTFAAFAAAALLCALCGGVQEARELRHNGPAQMLSDARAVNAYVLAHPDGVYIRDAYSAPDIDAFTVYPGDSEKPVNLLSWGGCGMRSEAYRRQLAVNGLQEGYAELFRQEGVYFLTATGSAAETALRAYLAARFGEAVVFTQSDTIGERFSVYRIQF